MPWTRDNVIFIQGDLGHFMAVLDSFRINAAYLLVFLGPCLPVTGLLLPKVPSSATESLLVSPVAESLSHSLPTSSTPLELEPVFHLIGHLSPTPPKKLQSYL